MGTNIFKYKNDFHLEKGEILKGLEIAYHTYGNLSPQKDNVVWICHALTANSDAMKWWPNLVGKGRYFDPEKYFIVCTNVLGSCYGTTGPMSINPDTFKPYYQSFPDITIRDIVNTHQLLAEELNIERINFLIGGSLGGQQAMEWGIISSQMIENLIILAANTKASPWNIAFSESQRMAIKSDQTFDQNIPEGGQKGLAAARAIALLSYRNSKTYNLTQQEYIFNKSENFRVSEYQQYQGYKLTNRFNAYSFYVLTKALDSHNIGRNREGIEEALSQIKAKTLLLGFSSDILFHASEVEFMKDYIPNSKYSEIDSLYGHDGFLIEGKKITNEIEKFYQ